MIYDIVLFIHVVSAIGIFGGLVMEWMLIRGLDRAHTDRALAEALAGFAILPVLGAPSTLLTLLSGIYLAAAASLWDTGWPVVAGASLVVLAVFGVIFGASRPAQAGNRLVRAHAPFPPRLLSALRSPVPRRSVWGRTWIAVGIVYLMTVKPEFAASVVVLAITLAAALATLAVPRVGKGAVRA